MPEAERFDVLVFGCGTGGKMVAWHMARAGHRTAVIERRWIGGSCHNVACLPSKNEIKSAEVADTVHHSPAFGTTERDARTDMARVLARKRAMVADSIASHLERFRASGAELILGEARFVGPKTLEVALNEGGTRLVSGDRIFLNLGTRPRIPPIPGLADVALTHIEMLELDRAPEHLVVLGGGYVGLEFAQAFRRFGSRVTVIQRGPQVLSREDRDVAEAMAQLLADEGIELLLGAETLRVDGGRGALEVLVRTDAGERTIAATDLMSATGRAPNTTGIGLDLAGIELDARGYVAVDERLETRAPDVWAIGDCAGSPKFTHVSFDDFRVIRDNLAGTSRTTRDRLVPFCLFTDPPLARVGWDEMEARRRGVPARVAKLPAREILRTHTTGATRGFMKALVAPQRDDILGFTMFGAEAGEVMAIVQTAILAEMPYTGLRDAILTHPTMAEGLNDLFAMVPPAR